MSYRYISIEIREQARFQLSRILAAGLLLIWICRLCLGIGLSQLMQPIFSDTKADRFYWLLDHLGILDALINYMPLSFGVDILLFLLPVLMIDEVSLAKIEVVGRLLANATFPKFLSNSLLLLG